MATIKRSEGVTVHAGALAMTVGGGQRGITSDLDAMVERAGELLSDRFEMPVSIRFNSDRESGGVFLVTHERDRVGANAEVGINVSVTSQRAHDVSERLERETGEGLDLFPVGTISVSAFLSARVMAPQYRDLCEGFHMDQYCSLLVPDVDCALAMVSALADLSRVDFTKEA